MPRNVRGALLQATWTGDKESMIQKHEQYAHEAKQAGAQIMLFQELFYGPYFCQVQETKYYDFTEAIPDGPTTQRFQSLARELGSRGVRANVVAPGYVKTALTDAIPEDARGTMLSNTPLGRLGDPENVAAAVRFLVSDEASFITGEVLLVDGGLGM